MADPESRKFAALRRPRKKVERNERPKTDTFAKVTWIEEKVAQSRTKGIFLGFLLAALVYFIFPAGAYETVMATEGGRRRRTTPTGRCG